MQLQADLHRNVAANGVRARACRMAVSIACESRRLSVSGGAAQYALNGPSALNSDTFEIAECVDIGRVFELTGASVCDFLKMDVEGEELAILSIPPSTSY